MLFLLAQIALKLIYKHLQYQHFPGDNPGNLLPGRGRGEKGKGRRVGR
jgi:hypothetical protein